MSTQQNIGIGICLLALLGLAYFFLYKKGTPVSSGVNPGTGPDAGTEMVEIPHSTEFHQKMAEFESRADHYRRQVAHLGQREALPTGLKENIYAFTEDVRQIDARKADKYNAEFCEGREATEPKVEQRSRSRSAIGLTSPATAPLNTNMRDNKASIFVLDPGQFNISHDLGARGLQAYSLSFSESPGRGRGSGPPEQTQPPQAPNFKSSPDVKAERGNPEATQL